MTIEVVDEYSRRQNLTFQRWSSHSAWQKRGLGLTPSDLALSYNTSQRVVVDVLQHSSRWARRLSRAVTENISAGCGACLRFLQYFFCRRMTSACVYSLLMTKLGSDFPLPVLSNQTYCGKTPIRPREETKCSPPFCGINWVCLVLDFLDYGHLTNTHTYWATIKIWDRPSKENISVLLALVWQCPTPQDTADSELAEQFALETFEYVPHSPDFLDPLIVICLPPDRALIKKSFHPRFCRHQTCHRHMGEATVLCVEMDKTITRFDKCLNHQVDYVE